MYQFYEIDLNVVCCVAPPKKMKDGVKTGIHLIWPRHFINCEDALIIREAILFKLNDHNTTMGTWKYDNPLNSWSDVLDELIYIRNGYRMVGSDKLVPKTREPENRPYTLSFVMDSLGQLREHYYERLCSDTYTLILDTSIRLTPLEGAQITIPFKKIPTWFPTKLAIRKNKSKGNSRKSIGIGTVESDLIQKFMDEKLPDVYKHQVIKDIRQYPDGNFLVITDSSYCMNIQRSHNSCGIYFFATRKGLYQKCLCPCDTLKGRITGYCKNYTSSCFEFPVSLSTLLFPKPEFIEVERVERVERVESGRKKKTKVVKSLCSTNRSYLKNHSNFCDSLFDKM
jgi:hypothetical protein